MTQWRFLFLSLLTHFCYLAQSFSLSSDSCNSRIGDVSIPQPEHHDQLSRRKLFHGTASTFISVAGIISSSPCLADETQVFKRVNTKSKFGYSLVLPPSYSESNKPLQTHLDEINLSDPDIKGCQIGITVDPIRLKSLKEFGTPDEVAAKIVMAELNRDGILEVTLGRDATEDAESGAYGELTRKLEV